MKRAILAAAVVVGALMPARPAAAHGGSDSDPTSNYRTRVLEVSDIDGLEARAVGLDGTIEIAWDGDGTLIVTGYEGEPYLRFDSTGVARNLRSPATYLNRDRYANAEVPSTADADAPPEWQIVTTDRRLRWHDHRTHWMSTALPPPAQADPGRSHVIYPRWEIPLTVDGRDAVVAGDLTWAPAPPMLPWIGLALLVAVGAGALLWTRAWRAVAVGVAAVGTSALAADTIGYVAELDATLATRVWVFVYPLVAAAATVRLALHAIRRTRQPTLAMMLVGLILLMMGAVDRFDVLTSGFYQSSLPVSAARVTTVVCLGTGAALIARFLRYLIPLLTTPTAPSTAGGADRADAT